MMMTVYLSHGLESGPGALKMQALKGIAEQLDDCEPVVMDYRGMDEPAERLKHLTATLLARGDDPARCVLAGSSLGAGSALPPVRKHRCWAVFYSPPRLACLSTQRPHRRFKPSIRISFMAGAMMWYPQAQ